ncbi:serine/threonine-protein kinase [Actinomadura latina]|uniref:non-specific serine/threonine protein kinase n=1 Tax=Actinomadura latina TaxID=163603 RepID=A0A846YS99_9ACTN|nr:serine/threonine-protein kinase [Actinomadura latina]NKZ02647.1 serine/threonine protein kinase [Actinomadura latina]
MDFAEGHVDGEWRVDGYTEVRELGAGAQGRVVLARHDASGTPVAIKYLATRADEADRERLRHEALMLGRAGSPHVARLFRLVEGPETTAIVMEAVDGVSLKELLERHGALGPEASLAVLKGSLLGLAAAHAVGVVHRDYKPANVVVPADGRSRLVDFGIAAPAGQEAGGAGTPYYMAPEQWSRHVATPASDVYAATCVFVECVTGQRPYAGDRAGLMRAHLTGEIPVEAVPEALRPLVLRGMAKAPEDRPGGASLFVDELERTARESYGGDWESRGVHALSAGAVALAALFPLAAWLVPGAAGAAGAASAAGAGGSAAGAAATTAKIAGGSAVKAFLGSGAGLTAVSVGTVAVVGAGAIAVQQLTEQDPAPRPTATAKAAATVADVRPCVVQALGGVTTPSGGPAKVTLPAQVKLPKNAAVYRSGQGLLIGPAGAQCEGSMGANAGSSTVGDFGTAQVGQNWQGSIGGIRSQLCEYFPDSPQARKERAQGNDCTSILSTRQPLETGVPGVQAVLTRGPGTDDLPPSPAVKAELSVLTTNGVAWPITCVAPAAHAGICKAALTYWFIQRLGDVQPAKADLDRAAASIAEFVDSTRI